MSSTKDPVTSASVDLDRAPIASYGAVKAHQRDGKLNKSPRDTDSESENRSRPRASSTRSKLRHVTDVLHSKLHIKQSETLVHSDQRVHADTEEAPVLAPAAANTRDEDRLFTSSPKKPK